MVTKATTHRLLRDMDMHPSNHDFLQNVNVFCIYIYRIAAAIDGYS